MAAKSRDSEKGTPKQLQEVVMTAAVGRFIEPAITTQLSEGKSKSNDTFPEDLGKEMRITATNKSQISTNGDLENYKVDDMAMGDEKPKENRRQQTSTAYTNRRSEILYAEVPPEKWKYSQLKMTQIIFFRVLLSGDVELNPGPREGRDRLSTDDLMVIQNELWDARSKWRNIGIQLQMKIADLEAIGEKHSNAPDSCFTDCITTWLWQTNPSPTWTALIKALRSSPVGFQEMAERLERKFLQPFLTDNQVFKFPHIDDDDDSTKYTEPMKTDTQVPEVPSPQVLSPQNIDETDYDLNSGDSEDHSSEQSSVVAESEMTNLSSILDPEANISAFLSEVHLTPGSMTMFTRRSRETQDKRIHLLQKQLQEVVVRAAVGGHVPPIELAISFCATQLSESRSNPKDMLDTFPESVNLKVQKKYQCHSPLMIVCEDDREDIVDVLLRNEATVALKNKRGLTAVHIVCRRGNLNVLKKLLDKAKNQQVYCAKKGKTSLPSDCEAVLLTRAKEGWYPVMYAVKEGHIEVVKECFDLVDHAITTKKKQTVLHIAARAGKLDCLKEIVPKISDDLKTAMDKNGWNVLHHACASGNLEVLKWLIDNMKDVCSDMLKQKCKCDYTPLSTACEYRKEDIVRYLLTLPDVDVSTMTTEPTDHGSEARERTPLHIAAAHNSTSIVELLIEEKHPLTVKDKNGDTALHYAYRSESMDVVNLLEQHSPEIKSIVNDNKELPEKVKRKDVIPLEILRRGVYAVEIYKRVLKKGKKKIPRCNLLILGEERVGKTSLYRLLVRKDFDQDLQPTRGIDGNEVDIVDERSITMGDHDEWKEKLEENKEEQINKMYIDSVSETLYAELPTSEEDKKEVFEPDPVLSEDELMKKIEDIRKQLERIREELTQQRVPSQYRAAHEAHIDRVPVHRERYPSAAPPKAPQDERQVQPRHPKPIVSTKRHQDKPKSEDTGTIPRIHKDSEISHVYSESEEVSVSTLGIPPEETKQEASTPNISRQESQIFNKKLKAKKKETKDKVTEPIKLELRALDFAGQKQYRPMHHCFIIRRAMYLVVFNLQTMIEYIEAEESKASDTIVGGDATRTSPSPIEQLRYWLYSIHAHIFPPNEGDTMRRVCLVGTHKFPQGKRQISEDDIKKIDKRLKCEFKRDERCVNMFHYMGPSKAKQIFTCVENSVDGKKQEDREKSGALCLQKELKLVCNQLKFLDEDHPLIWLRFEHGLIKMRQNLVQKKRPLFVSVDEVLKLAESQGVDDAESQKLALNFFHDTGKLVYLERVPTLYLSKEEQKELAELIILDPVWLTRVMRAVVELDTDDYSGDRIPAVTLVEDGIASEELLMKIWAEFLGDTDDRDQAFHHLCTILKAYCLIYPLKKNAIPNLEDRPEEPPSPGDSFSHSESERRSAVAILNKDFLIPCMLPETVERKDDSHLNWITFFFDFEKFLPEVLYHRFLCQLLADCHTSPQCYKSWSQFNNIHGCNWKIEPMRDVHRLRISVLSKDTTNLSQHIVYIHKNYLRRICAESEFIGLKYHGGPVAKCQCKEEYLKVLQCVSFCMEKKTSDEPKLILDCEHCLVNQNVEQLLQLQVKDWNAYLSVKEIQSPLSSEDGKAQRILDDKHDKSNEPPVLREAFKILVRKSDRWRNIGLLLDLDNRALGKIDAECRGIPDDCLREMLSLWLNQVNPQPTRKALAEAVEVYDPALAKQILN